nr:kunitz-type elastase inhibitor BrEI-like [Ipomoea batatas]GMD71717.1 kunitz-type elastase inhibitor BrEI-like [Ipomoea batatas]GMD88379.1 kunitz-type elastase inhibitor BrEI-like [Ipomoea batatas]GMD95457.1 kunitz-type elastase inhibitor BrEI-like [Ipomoea batatas]
MKTTIIVFFLLLSICVHPLTISASSPFIRLPTEAGSPVLDTQGNAVVGGSLYLARVSEIILGVEGGISVTNFKDSAICPTYAYLNLSIPPQPQPKLTPIIFHSLNDDPTGVIYESDPIYVEFYEVVESCPTSWNLFQNIIVAGFGPSKFSIKASDSSINNSYIFAGIGIVDDQNRLGIADYPYDFQFDRILL